MLKFIYVLCVKFLIMVRYQKSLEENPLACK